MKKTIAAIVTSFVFVGVASATDVTVTAGKASGDLYAGAVTVSQQLPQGFGVGVGYERTQRHAFSSNTATLTASKELIKVGTASVNVYGGGAFTQATGGTGFGLVYGVQTSVPVTQNVALVVDAQRISSQNRARVADSNRVTAGLKFAF